MVKKLTIEIVKQRFAALNSGYTLLSGVYVNNDVKLNFQCDKGHQYQVEWDKFQRGQRCKKCSGKEKLTIEFVKNEVLKRAPGYHCLSDVYIGNNSKLSLRCDIGHKYFATWRAFQSGNRCSECCKNSIDFVKNEVSKRAPGYQCLSDVYKNAHTKLNLICDRGHEYAATWNIFNRGGRCLKCSNRKKLTIEFVKNEVSKRAPGYQLLNELYINNSTKLNFICDYDHHFSMSWDVFQRGVRCAKCDDKKKSGKGHHNYRHDLSKEDRLYSYNRGHNPENHQWRNKIFKRDRYTCQYCLTTGNKLNAHHIHNYADHKDLRFDLDNGITLCVTCHRNYHSIFGYKNNTKIQLNQWFINRI